MSYAENLKQKLNIDNSEPISAVIYARVSTDNDGQKDSCSNQVALLSLRVDLQKQPKTALKAKSIQ